MKIRKLEYGDWEWEFTNDVFWSETLWGLLWVVFLAKICGKEIQELE